MGFSQGPLLIIHDDYRWRQGGQLWGCAKHLYTRADGHWDSTEHRGKVGIRSRPTIFSREIPFWRHLEGAALREPSAQMFQYFVAAGQAIVPASSDP